LISLQWYVTVVTLRPALYTLFGKERSNLGKNFFASPKIYTSVHHIWNVVQFINRLGHERFEGSDHLQGAVYLFWKTLGRCVSGIFAVRGVLSNYLVVTLSSIWWASWCSLSTNLTDGRCASPRVKLVVQLWIYFTSVLWIFVAWLRIDSCWKSKDDWRQELNAQFYLLFITLGEPIEVFKVVQMACYAVARRCTCHSWSLFNI